MWDRNHRFALNLRIRFYGTLPGARVARSDSSRTVLRPKQGWDRNVNFRLKIVFDLLLRTAAGTDFVVPMQFLWLPDCFERDSLDTGAGEPIFHHRAIVLAN